MLETPPSDDAAAGPAWEAGAEARIEPAPDHAEEDPAYYADNVVPSRGYAMLPMVGLGGSAGSIQALQEFFAAMPANSGMAFVVVLHLAADRESALAEILQRSTSMPVQQVDEVAKVEADHVYVIPPGKTLLSANGLLRCTDLTPDRGRRVAVDLFFRTLADTHGPRASAVVLSGADGDGAIGIKRIKERGGLTIAQDPDEAEFDGMPRGAITTGMVDWVLRVADMPARLSRYNEILPRLKLPPEDGETPAEPETAVEVGFLESILREVLTYLRAQTGRDFSYYKRATILRRIGRRMGVNGIEALPDYLAFMRTHPGEAGALLKDLLISVTNFFRDREAFDALTAQIPTLFVNKAPGEAVRIWVAGCASGEEAYSIAMLLAEHARTLDDPPPLQVFATDLDEDAIRIGREAAYPQAIVADLSEERLRRFFIKEHRGYVVRSEIREMVLFAIHDLLRDAPFSRIDLFSCRNLLIYLKREAQARVFETAHFALRNEGRLFLGASETVDAGEKLFTVVDKKHRLYQARAIGRHPLPGPVGQSTLARAMELQERNREAPGSFPGLGLPQRGPPPLWTRPSPADVGLGSWRELHLKLIEHFAPPSIVVTKDHEIVHLSERAGQFLRFAGGEPTSNLLSAVEPALSIDLRTALLRAKESGAPIVTAPVAYADGETTHAVALRVSQADDLAPGFLVVSFELLPAGSAAAAAVPLPSAGPYEDRLAEQLEEMKWHLRDVTERNEAGTQELKASNEELQAMNEELRSATEELETSREELQSINEELTTVNQELKSNVEELGRSNGDLQNLMASTAIATVFLDRDLRITLFTPSAVALFNVIASDVGRPLSDLAHRLEYAEMSEDARRVLDHLVPIEREVRAGARSFLARVLPYRSGEDRIAGVVYTFLDITVRKSAEDALRASEEQFRTIVSQAAAGVGHADAEGLLTFVNPRFSEITGYPAAALIGTRLFDLVHPDDRDRNQEAYRTTVTEGKPFDMERRFVHRDGSVVWVSTAITPVGDQDGQPVSAIVILLDITERRDAEAATRESEERLRLVLENAREYAIVSMDLDRRITGWNGGAEQLLGYSAAEILGHSADRIFVDEDRAAGVPEREGRQAIEEGRAADERWHLRKDGTRFFGSGVMMVMRAEGDGSHPIGLLKIFRDQTGARTSQEALETSRAELVRLLADNRRARAEAEAANHAKDRFLAILSHELRTPLTPVVMALHALERSADMPVAARGTIELIRRNVRTELHLIDDLLDVTRISSGKMEVLRDAVDLHAVVRAAAEICAADFASKRIDFSMALAAQRHQLPGDAQRLEQVMWNLLKNAAKFTPPDGRVGIETRNVDGRVQVIVSDTGVGIDAEALATVFDAFAQEGEWVTTEFGGLGLGLAIAKSIVEAHHGSLLAASGGRGRGAVFTIELPVD